MVDVKEIFEYWFNLSQDVLSKSSIIIVPRPNQSLKLTEPTVDDFAARQFAGIEYDRAGTSAH